MELTPEIRVADRIGTLFAAQIDDTHDRIFLHNNKNFLSSMGEDVWAAISQRTLDQGITAVVASDTTTLPAEISEQYDATAEFVNK